MTNGENPSGESRMLIDGELVDAASGQQFDNINPATEEVLGQVADAGHEDMDRAIAAARRAFDETDWADRPRVAAALPRPAAGRAGGRDRSCSGPSWWPRSGARCCSPTARSSTRRWPRGCPGRPTMIDEFEWERDLPEGTAFGTRQLAQGGEGAGRRRRRPSCRGTSRSR